METENFSVINKTKSRSGLARTAFLNMKNAVLGKNYVLSLAFVGNTTSKKLNRQYRKKNTPTNILSFSLQKYEGEIIMDLAKIKKETKFFDRSFGNLVAFLFIHGLFHLKGLRHGSTMERKEALVRKKFKI
ncbi:MAG: rRNA maturation RNase YbeY [bacterium]|nr:rRNA maturation RNase YbeY [bacterium]